MSQPVCSIPFGTQIEQLGNTVAIRFPQVAAADLFVAFLIWLDKLDAPVTVKYVPFERGATQ